MFTYRIRRREEALMYATAGEYSNNAVVNPAYEGYKLSDASGAVTVENPYEFPDEHPYEFHIPSPTFSSFQEPLT